MINNLVTLNKIFYYKYKHNILIYTILNFNIFYLSFKYFYIIILNLILSYIYKLYNNHLLF